MDSYWFLQVGKGGLFGDFFGDLTGLFIDLLVRFTIKLFFRTSSCDPACENTVKIWVSVIFIWLIVIGLYFLVRKTKRVRSKRKNKN
jgi:hypothetical protein